MELHLYQFLFALAMLAAAVFGLGLAVPAAAMHFNAPFALRAAFAAVCCLTAAGVTAFVIAYTFTIPDPAFANAPPNPRRMGGIAFICALPVAALWLLLIIRLHLTERSCISELAQPSQPAPQSAWRPSAQSFRAKSALRSTPHM